MSAPLIYVDLIEETPKSLAEWAIDDRRVDADSHDPNYIELVKDAHGHYLANFQPWRILVRSGDNHEPLFRSTERYFNRADAINAVWLAFGAESNVYLREAEEGDVELRLAAKGGGSTL